MEYFKQAITKRWLPILTEYEKIKKKVQPRSFRFVKDLYLAHHTSKKEILRYYRKWVAGGKQEEALLPKKRDLSQARAARQRDRANHYESYRRFGSNRYELVMLFKPYYLDKTPSAATMDRIKARYPLNESAKKIIKRYEKQVPGEWPTLIYPSAQGPQGFIQITRYHVAAICDDCTRLTYAEVLKAKKATTLSFFMMRALAWFKQLYNFEFEAVMSDNGGEFRGVREHPFELVCTELGIRHILTQPYHPQTNGKIEAFWKILQKEFFHPNHFDSMEDMALNLGNFLFEYNHLRKHGGLNYETPFDKLEKVTELLS